MVTDTNILDRLNAFRTAVRKRLLLDGVMRVLVAFTASILISLLLDHTFRLSLPARLVLVVIAMVALLVLIWRFIVDPLRMTLDPLSLAAAIDRRDGSNTLTARVATVLHLHELLDSPSPPSAAMVRVAVEHCETALASVDLHSRLNDHRRDSTLFIAAAALLLPILLVMIDPHLAGIWAKRMLLGRSDPWPQNTYLRVAGLEGDTIVVPRGEPFVLRVTPKVGSAAPPAVWLRYREAGGSKIDGGFTAFSPVDFRYDFAAIDSPMQVEIWGGDDTPAPFVIRPADRPRVTDLKLIAQHPTEPKPTTFTFGGESADLSFLPRTKMQLLVTANTPIASAKLTSSAAAPSPADLSRVDDTHFVINWQQQASVQLHLEMTGRDAGLVSVPTDVSIGLKRDQPPRVTIAFSGVRARVTPQARIPLTVDARDDYAVKSLALSQKAESPDPADPAKLAAHVSSQSLYSTDAGEPEVQAAPAVEVSALKLPPGSLLTLTAVAIDNCYTGSQTTASRAVTFRIVPPEELFREILLRQQSERAKFRRQVDEAQAIAGLLMSPPTTVDAAAAIAHRHRSVQRDVGRTTLALSDSLTEMKLNVLGTPESYELMQRNVINPLRELSDGLLNAQKDRLETLRPGDAAAYADARDRQTQVVARMQEILKLMSQWDSFVDVLNQLNEVIRLQDQAQQTTTQLKKQDTESIFEK